MNDELVRVATAAREHAFAPYSRFRVGAALQGESGTIYKGCNVEGASYGLTVCAERVAIWKAVSEGERRFRAICVVADTAELTPPCGACRQIIWEFCGDIPVILANLTGNRVVYSMAELLPRPFDGGFLG
ncbi:MAG TPA: cytidine deaminase [Acidobacteriota bacterium]|nr:cytidine deaminase [Acidobacteriota bacterium]